MKYLVQGTHEMILLHWEDTKGAERVSWHFYDEQGNEIEAP